MQQKTVKDYFLEFKTELCRLNDDEFIGRFNGTVGISAFGFARQGYLWALKEELKRREIDFSSVGDEKIMSYKYVVFLKDRKLFRFSELDKNDAENWFKKYMSENHLDKIKFNPRMIEYNDDQIRFGMQKHQGVFVMETNNIAKKTTGNNAYKK